MGRRLENEIENDSVQEINTEGPLPSRRAFRRSKKKKKKHVFKMPAIQLLAIFFVLMPAAVLYLISVFEGPLAGALDSGRSGYETVRVAPHPVSAQPDERGQKIHIVEAGETLRSIALLYYGKEEKAEQIKKRNELTSDSLQAGQKLVIPVQ